MLPPETAALLGPMDPDTPAPEPQALAAVVEPLLAADALNGTVSAAVYDMLTGTELYVTAADAPMTPASSTKVVTAAAVLATRGPGYRIPTRVLAGPEPGQVVLVADGDITLSVDGTGFYEGAASLQDLADQVRRSLGDQPVEQILFDGSAFTGDPVAEGVVPGDIGAGYTAPMAPLMTDGGRVDPAGENYSARFDDPVRQALDRFAAMLDDAEVSVSSEPIADPQAEELGVVHSAPVQRLVEQMLLPSDNTLADALARQVALAVGTAPVSFVDGAQASMDVLADAGVPLDNVVLHDGSGLSMDNRLPAQTLAGIVLRAGDGTHPEFSGLLSGLPVAAWSGSLDRRYQGENAAGAGYVRAKTGTLDGASSLTGILVTRDGRVLSFALMANGFTNLFAVESALDAVAAAMTECGCR